jgi:polyketide cyclase/dehydrase/lipid transport protein
MLKWIVIGAGILLALIVATVAIGYMLPQQHTASRAISLRQKPSDVFALISDFKAAPSWRPEVQRVELLKEVNGQAGFSEESENGVLTMTVVELKPPERMVTQIADKELPFGGRWIFEIFPQANGCRLNITERGEIYNPVFRFVSRFFLGYHRTLDTYLQNVSRKFGENAATEEGKAAVE